MSEARKANNARLAVRTEYSHKGTFLVLCLGCYVQGTSPDAPTLKPAALRAVVRGHAVHTEDPCDICGEYGS